VRRAAIVQGLEDFRPVFPAPGHLLSNDACANLIVRGEAFVSAGNHNFDLQEK